jgi:CTP synthase
MTKYVFITGGVVSSLGKGLTSASIGLLLENRGLKISIQKFDPYINVDPGTMNPFQHGEVYVTDDGAETDLDLGHYERFTNVRLTKDSNFTTGRIYSSVIAKERRGEYLGKTVQVVPHITDEIKAAIKKPIKRDIDVALTEIGGTVGDIEGLPFLEALRQFRLECGPENVLFIHLTLIPYLSTSGELKTKPTQHSVGKLREIGIQPDILICRTEKSLTEEMLNKIALFCNVPREAVIEEKNVDYSIYEVPVMLSEQGLDKIIIKQLKLKCRKSNLQKWHKMLNTIKNPRRETEIAMVGKYLELTDSYKSINESLAHAGIANNCRVKIRKVNAEDVEKYGAARLLKGVKGILVPGGFGERGIEGKIKAIEYARTKKVPFFGLCLGMQCAVIEFARNVLGWKKAHSTEFNKQTPYPVIDLMSTQLGVKDMGGTMRLGSYACSLTQGSFAARAYGAKKTRLNDARSQGSPGRTVGQVCERHRHRYEFNDHYRQAFLDKGLKITGICPDNNLVEIIELKKHPWFLAVQFHPEFKSKPVNPHPLFRDFIKYSLKQ